MTDAAVVFPEAAIRTLYASWWTLRLAKWFGRKKTVRDGPVTVTVSRWCGVLYLVDYRNEENPGE